jgi:hypothetical protein
MAPKFIKEIMGDFVGNLGNLWKVGKKDIKMLPKSSKVTIKNKHVFCARPMVKDGSGFGFESLFFTNAPIALELEDQDHLYVQFYGSATSWITGAEIKDGKYVAHKKLGRAARIQIKNPKLYSVKKTNGDGHTYTEYFLRVDEAWQVAPSVDHYRNTNLVEIGNMIGQTI